MYSITLRETNEFVKVRCQPEFVKQVEQARKLRSLLGDKASGVLFVNVQRENGEMMRVDTKALIVRFYRSKDQERAAMFAEAERLLMVEHDFDKSEEMFWLAITKVSLIDSGAVNPNGSLKPYSLYDNHRHRGNPLPAEEVDGDELQYFDAGY